MKGQTFLLTAIIVASALILLKVNINLPTIAEKRRELEARFEAEFFENVREEFENVIHISSHQGQNITENLFDFANFTNKKMAERLLDFELLLLGAITPASSGSATMNVSVINLLATQVNLTLQLNESAPDTQLMNYSKRWDTNYTITQGSNYVLTFGRQRTIESTLKTLNDSSLQGDAIFAAGGSNISYGLKIGKEETVHLARMTLTGLEYSGNYPLVPNLDIGNDGDVDWSATPPSDWWNASFYYRVRVDVTEGGTANRTNEPVDVFLDFPSDHAYDDSIRVIGSDGSEIPSSVWNSTYSGSYYDKATITFAANVTQGGSNYYYVYYSGIDVGEPVYVWPLSGSGDGFEDGIRDSLSGGSYWLDENGRSLTSGLVGYWKFSEDGGNTAKDSSGYGNDGTLHNGTTICSGGYCPTWVDGKYGKALEFDGDSDYVETTNQISIDTSQSGYTIVAWIYQRSDCGYNWNTVAGIKMNSVRLGISTQGGTDIGAWACGNLGTDVSVGDFENEWHHIAAVFTKNITGFTPAKMYFDGDYVGESVTDRSTPCSATDYFDIAESYGGYNTWFNGTIDEVRIYDRALDSEEIRALHQAGRIKLSNDFLSVRASPYVQLNVTNGTDNDLYKIVTEEILVDGTPLSNIYPANPINDSMSVYFFDWASNEWKVWMKGINNLTHGTPDWLDPRFKEAFKWRYEFKRDDYPSINTTFLMTAHDPFVRVFTDTYGGATSNIDTNGLVGRWKLNSVNATNGTLDSSGNGNDGIAINFNTDPASTVDGKFDQALEFDGSDDYVNVSDNAILRLSTNQTIEAWINVNADAGWVRLVGKGNSTHRNYGLWREADGDMLFQIYGTPSNCNFWDNAGPGSDSNIAAGSGWRHFVGTYDGSVGKLYIDGKEVHSSSCSITPYTSDDPLTFAYAGFETHFNGKIDEVRVWNRTLTADEVRAQYGSRHNLTISISLGQTKTRGHTRWSSSGWLYSIDGGRPWALFNSSGYYTGEYCTGGSPSPLNEYQASPVLAFTSNNQNENVLWTSYNFQPGYQKRGDFQVKWYNGSVACGNIDRLEYDYDFNSTNNNNFLFNLGYTDSIKTTNWGYGTGDNPSTASIGFSNETLEAVANSTLTYYGLREDGVILYLPFEEGTGNVTRDALGRGNDGTLKPTGSEPVWKSGRFGNGLEFDGVDDYVEIADDPSLEGMTNGLTVCMWVKPNFSEGDSGVNGNLLNNNRYHLFASGDWGFGINVRNSTGSWSAWAGENSFFSAGNWYHVCGRYDPTISEVRLFVDAKPYSTESLTGDVYSSTDNHRIGRELSGTAYRFNGTIDEVKIYDRALSQEEIQRDMQEGINWHKSPKGSYVTGHEVPFSFNYDGGASAVWHFDEGGGTNVTDSSGNGKGGRIEGNTTWVDGKFGSALNFSGSNDMIEIPSPYVDLGNEWTIETWFHYPLEESTHWRTLTRGNGGDHQIIVQTGAYNLGTYDNTGGTGFKDSGYDVDVLSTGWHHLVTVQDGKDMIFYIDGSRVGTVSNYISTTDVRSIGNYFGGGQEWGVLDEFRIYPRALMATEVYEHYAHEVSKYYDDFGVGIKRYAGVEDSSTNLQPITPKDTVLHFRFNDNSTVNATDISGYGNDGRVEDGGGNYTWMTNSSCKNNFYGCVYFDGVNDYIEIPHSTSLDITEQITLAAWVYTPMGGGEIVEKWNSYEFRVRPAGDGRAQAGVWLGGGTYNGVMGSSNLEGKWAHIVFTYDRSQLKLYVNGSLVDSYSNTTAIDSTTNNVYVSRAYTTGVGHFNGTIDEVLIINRSLSADEIHQLYLGGYNRTIDGNVHRVASADDLPNVLFNLTNHYPQLSSSPNSEEPEAFNKTETTSDFSVELNSLLPSCSCSGCIDDSQNCTIPLNFTSKSAGKIRISNVNVLRSYWSDFTYDSISIKTIPGKGRYTAFFDLLLRGVETHKDKFQKAHTLPQ